MARMTPTADPRRVAFDASFRGRLERFTLRLDGARRRREGPGRSTHFGSGEEWVGFRPYRPGDDPRQIDWNLLGRLDRAFVRVTRREVSEDWVVLLDASASMGLGAPSKLQAAAELCAAVTAAGLRRGAQVTVCTAAAERCFRRGAELMAALEFIERTVAEGEAGLPMTSPALRSAGRVVVIGDLIGTESARLVELARGRRELAAAQVLAPCELTPEPGTIRWTCPESGGALDVAVGPALQAAYDRELRAELEAWRAACSHHGVRYTVASSARAFEDVATELFDGAA